MFSRLVFSTVLAGGLFLSSCQLKANPTEENKQLAATFLGFESVEQYNALNKPFLESLAKLTEKYPALRKMKEAELKELYGKALTDDVRYTNMVNQEIGNRGNSVLKNICLLAVTAGTIAANTLLCAPLGFPLGQLCNLGISLAAQALNGLCDLLFFLSNLILNSFFVGWYAGIPCMHLVVLRTPNNNYLHPKMDKELDD